MIRRALRTGLAAAGLLAVAGAARAATVDEDIVPGGVLLSTIRPAAEVETYRFAAPKGSLVLLDLRPATKGGFSPSFQSIRLGETALPPPAAGATGRSKAKFRVEADGILEVIVRGDGVATGDYALRATLKPPRSTPFSGAILAGGSTDVVLFAPAEATATVQAKRSDASSLVPRIVRLDPAATGADDATPGAVRETPTSVTWKKVPLAAPGLWTLTVTGHASTGGAFAGTVKWKVRRGAGADRREPSVPAALRGTYSSFLISPPSPSNPAGTLLTGDVTFDGKGGLATALRTLVLVPDASSPLGVGFQVVSIPPSTGTYFTDGVAASLSMDLGTGTPFTLDVTVSAGGNVLVPATPPETGPTTVGAFLKGAGVPTPAALAGSWFYMNYEAGDSGQGVVEIGTLTLTAGGTATGIGAAVALDASGGTPVPGTPIPTLRAGSFSVAPSGTVTFSTAPLFQPADVWSADPVFLNDILLGRGPDGAPASVMRAFFRQGTGLDASDVAGAYLHFGVEVGAATQARAGSLFFDGAGGFSGAESVFDFSTGSVTPAQATPGTYTVSPAGTATFQRNGGPAGSGIVGPEGNYLLTLALDGSGVALDFLLFLYEPEDL